MRELTEIKNNKVHKSLLKLFDGQRILFLENDNGLYNSVGNFETWLVENKIRYNALFDVSNLSMDYIKGQIEWANIIVFETTWTYEVARNIENFLTAYKDKKIIMECYIHEPSWWRKPKGVIHDMYVLQSSGNDMDDWNLDKLRVNKATWDD